MPDTPFKAMGREKRVRIMDTLPENWYGYASEKCERCGGYVYNGDWPFCKGDPKDHRRD